MLYGRDAIIPLGIDNEEVKSKSTLGPAAYLNDLKIVVEKLKKAQDKQKERYKSKHRSKQSKSLDVGEIVLLKNYRARG